MLLSVLRVVFGWSKLTDYGGTVGDVTQAGVPMCTVAALAAILVEVPVALAVRGRDAPADPPAGGPRTGDRAHRARLLGHEGAAWCGTTINLYRNVSIIGGFLLLHVAGPGRYPADAKLGNA
nr:DoxX family protein [Roseicella aquatilis]